jgi:hypothetical protein
MDDGAEKNRHRIDDRDVERKYPQKDPSDPGFDQCGDH